MKRNILFSLVTVIGIAILVTFTIVRKNHQKLLKEYGLAKARFHMTDEDMAYFAQHRAELFEGIKRQDEAAAAVALTALAKLERGDIEETRKILETEVSIYYRGHRDEGNRILLRNVERFAVTNTSLSNAIYKRSE